MINNLTKIDENNKYTELIYSALKNIDRNMVSLSGVADYSTLISK